MDKYGRWKNAVEGKGLSVNVNNTKGMQLLFWNKSSVSKVEPCGVCVEQVGCNSIQSTKYQRWFRRRSDLPKQVSLLRDVFVSRIFLGHYS